MAVLKLGRPGTTTRRTNATVNPGRVLSGSQGTAVPARNTGAYLTRGVGSARPTVPLAVHSVATQQTPHGAVQRQTFMSPLKPNRF